MVSVAGHFSFSCARHLMSADVEADDLAMTFFESVTIWAIIIFAILVAIDILPAS